MSNLTYREHFVTSVIMDIVFFFILYFLWKAIYAEQSQIAGLSFQQTYVMLALSSCLFRTLSSGTEWDMCYSMMSGDIIIRMVKPVDYMMQLLAEKVGMTLTMMMTHTIPVFLIISLLFPGVIHFGWNFLLFLLCMCISFFVMFTFEFIIGVVTFYTESVWGISTIKDILISFFAGVEVPLAFFPEWLGAIANVLPFKSLYNDPIQVLLNTTLNGRDYARIIGFELMWAVLFLVIARGMYEVMKKKIVVNGG